MHQLTITNARAVVGNTVAEGQTLICDNGVLTAIGVGSDSSAHRTIDASGLTVVPGFIELHMHGFGGRDSREGTSDAVTQMAVHAAKFGVTATLITLTTLSDDNIQVSTAAVREAMTQQRGAQIIGIHYEGPFLNPKFKGGIFGGGLCAPSVQTLTRYLGYCGDALKAMTLAPELDGSDEVVSLLRERGVLVSIGHSGATYDEALRAIRTGCNYATHVFNGMPPITGRDPGIAGAVLYEDECYVEIIADGHHVAVANVLAVLKLKPHSRICLVTDACKAAGTAMTGFDNPSGFYVEIRDGRTWGPEGKLVGSVLTLDMALRNIAVWTNLALQDILPFVTENPARLLGLYPRKGLIAIGSDADFAILDDQGEVVYTVGGGEIIYAR